MKFIFEQLKTGGDRNFGYLIADRESGEGALIDPSYSPEKLVNRADLQKIELRYIFNTHGHGDHTNGNECAQELSDAPIAAFSDSLICPDKKLEDGDQIKLGSLTIRVLHVPGHLPDHVVLFIEPFQIAFTGDHLFVGKIGGTHSDEDAKLQYKSLHRLLDELPGETTVWPGHDVGARPSSTLRIERASNPFLQVASCDEFIELKQNWAEFKRARHLL